MAPGQWAATAGVLALKRAVVLAEEEQGTRGSHGLRRVNPSILPAMVASDPVPT